LPPEYPEINVIDYNEKFRRRAPAVSLDIDEIRELVDPNLEELSRCR